VANADPMVSQDPNEPSEIVEFTRSGHFVRQYSVDPNLGSAFALGTVARDGVQVFAYVDDFLSNCTILNLAVGMPGGGNATEHAMKAGSSPRRS